MRTVTAVTMFSAAILAGCDKPTPPAPTPGGRAAIDAATKAYGDCVSAAARRLPIIGDTPGNIADSAIASCKAVRAAMLPKVRDFYLAGHKATPGYAANVAEASVATLEDDIRTRAVIAIVERQNKAK